MWNPSVRAISLGLASLLAFAGFSKTASAQDAVYEIVRQLSPPVYQFETVPGLYAGSLETFAFPALPEFSLSIGLVDRVKLRLLAPPGMKFVLSASAYFNWPGDISILPTPFNSGALSSAPVTLSFIAAGGTAPAPGIEGFVTGNDWLLIRTVTFGAPSSANFEFTEIVLTWEVTSFSGDSRVYSIADAGGTQTGPEVTFIRYFPVGSDDPGPFVTLPEPAAIPSLAVGAGMLFWVRRRNAALVKQSSHGS